MEFDEYDYLEKTVENSEPSREKEAAENGGDEAVKSGEKERRSSRRRNDENDEDLDSRTKRARSEDDGRERERHRDRDRDWDRDRERERERERERRGSSRRDGEGSERDRGRRRSSRERRDRDKEREERNGRERERGRDKERDHDRDGQRERSREKSKDKDRDRDREREGRERDREIEREKERERERSRRSRSHSERRPSEHLDRDVERERSREKSRDREFRERERRPREKKDGEPEADPERDQRTVFAYQISLKADERDVYEFFSRAGKVRDVRLIMDRNSRRSKGVGYIEFYDAMSVPMAIALSGQPLLGQPVMVKPSEAEKNLVQSNTTVIGPGGSIGPYSGGARRLYVGNLHFNITEDQLRQVFEPFGSVELVQLPLDPDTGHCKGFGFVQFARLEDARAAQSLNGQLDIAGRVIKVSAVCDQVGMQDVGVNAGDFDDDEGGGLSLNARSRAILMQKLDRSGTASSIAGSLGSPVVTGSGVTLPAPLLGPASTTTPLISSLGQLAIPAVTGLPGSTISIPAMTVPTIDSIGVPSECLLLRNMFDPNSEIEPDFDLDIKEDVQEECSKFGTLKHIYVDKNTAGFVYLRFGSTESAMKAQRALHGRWFAGKMITAAYIVPHEYEVKFPESQ